MPAVLQKFIAESGFCSRRKAEELIRQKKVLINNKIAELGARVSAQDEVKINNQIIKIAEEKVYLKLNKPIGYVCTNRVFKGEKNIFELLPVFKERLFVVGRLDKNSRGLVILTNDGNLAQRLTHPSLEHEKEYLVKLDQLDNKPDKIKSIINILAKGVDIGENDGIVKAKKIFYLGENKFKIVLTEGKKRQIRRMFQKINYKVIDLARVRIGDFNLGNLKEGRWEKLCYQTPDNLAKTKVVMP